MDRSANLMAIADAYESEIQLTAYESDPMMRIAKLLDITARIQLASMRRLIDLDRNVREREHLLKDALHKSADALSIHQSNVTVTRRTRARQ